MVVLQTAPVWPYTMRDTKGEAARGGLAVPVVMLSADDGARLRAMHAAAAAETAKTEAAAMAAAPLAAPAAASADTVPGTVVAALASAAPPPPPTAAAAAAAPTGAAGGCCALRGILHVTRLEAACPICQEDYETVGSVVTRLPCRHLFHEPCIAKWFKQHNTCPACRFEMPTDDEDYEAERLARIRERAQNDTWRSLFQ